MDTLQKLRDYINENRGSQPPVANLDEPLRIDSLSFIRLVTFLDTDLDVRVEEDELVAENFATMRALEKLVTAKLAQAKQPAQAVDTPAQRNS